jgi:hypothetical protein
MSLSLAFESILDSAAVAGVMNAMVVGWVSIGVIRHALIIA